MKRILLSLLCGVILVAGYFILVAILHQAFQLSLETVAILLKPLNLPYDIYKSIFGLYYGERSRVLILNQAANVLIYSAIFYFISTQYAKFKKKSEIKVTESPPEPPLFN